MTSAASTQNFSRIYNNLAVPDGLVLSDRRSLRPPFANAHRPHFVVVGKGLTSLTETKSLLLTSSPQNRIIIYAD